jgi:hypothetical protein
VLRRGPDVPDSAVLEQLEPAETIWVSNRPVAVFNAADLEGAELLALLER